MPNLMHRSHLKQGSPEYGHAFEHLIIQEIMAYLGYQGRQSELSYWRTGTGVEIDAVLGDAAVGIEIKSTNEVKDNQLKGLRSFGQDYPDARLIVVSNDMYKRRKDNVEIFPVKEFLSDLWAGKIV